MPLKKVMFFFLCVVSHFSVEDQVVEVYRDFEAAVHVDPERMKRRSQASSETSSIASRDLK